jgi:ComF family protein
MARFTQGLQQIARHVFARACDGLLSRVCALCEAPLHSNAAGLGLCVHCGRSLPRLAERCPRCAEPSLAGSGECGRCRRDPPAFTATLVLADYAPPVDRLVHAMKFRRERSLARPMGLLMAEQLAQARASHKSTPDSLFKPLALVPIPLSPERLVQRGFNQAQAIAQTLADSSGVPLNTRLLRRARHTLAQAGLNRGARQGNIADAFECLMPVPARVALVDDVMTSGATLRAAALALQQAGAHSIINLVFARTAADHVSRRSGPS